MDGYENDEYRRRYVERGSLPEQKLPKAALRVAVESLLQCSEAEMASEKRSQGEGSCSEETVHVWDDRLLANMGEYRLGK